MLSDDEGELRRVASSGYREDFVQKYRRIPVDSPVAVAECVRVAEPVWLESLDESAEQYPELEEGGLATGGSALAAVPLIGSAGPFGFLSLRFEGPRRFAPE